MPINILMPALSPTMDEGTLARWLVKEGERVTSGTVIAEIETDKATMEFEAVHSGTIGRIVVPEGRERVKVNDLIAVLLEDGESADEVPAEAPTLQLVSSPVANPIESGRHEHDPVNGGGSAPHRDRVFASPLARRLAQELDLDLERLTGSGPNGRVVKADVLAAKQAEANQFTQAEIATKPQFSFVSSSEDKQNIRNVYAERAFEEIPLDGMRATIATRLIEAKRSTPYFHLRRDIVIDDLLILKRKLNEHLVPRGLRLTLNDFIIKASAIALQEVPDCNAVWAGDGVFRFKASDISVAVAAKGGLYTPVLRDAEAKTLSSLSSEMKVLVDRARHRTLAPEEYQGGSFTISNLGMMGVDNFDAVINPPHASVLAVGSGVKKPVVTEAGAIEVATVMSVTLSADHRVIDGALGANFLQVLKTGLEHPALLLA